MSDTMRGVVERLFAAGKSAESIAATVSLPLAEVRQIGFNVWN